jgi:tricorn protease
MRKRSSAIVGVLLLYTALFLGAEAALAGNEAPLWLRHPALSPDGQTVAFDFRGDLYTVPAAGGVATPLTLHDAHDRAPIWSPDGKWLAFASDRFGNWDIFLVPATGGQVTRLTFHSGPDTPCSFTPDGKYVLFTATRLDARTNAEFPHYRALPELYRVPVDAGRPEQVLTIPAMEAVYDSKQERLLYSENTSLEDELRKHNVSAFTRDIWLLDVKTDSYMRVAAFEGGEFTPVWDPAQAGFFYLSEQSGDFNIWHMPLDGSGQATQITSHEKHPARSLSASKAGDLCYSFDGEIWLRPAGSDRSEVLPVIIRTEDPNSSVEHIKLSRGITEFALSPTGKEIAFVNRGEIFVTAVDHDLTKRVTDTPEQERSVSFSPDGRSLLYAGERGGSWNLYRTDLTRDGEPYFFGATLLKETPVLEIEAETYQPAWSPDGKEVAYLEERTTLKVLNLESGDTRVVLPGDRNYSYTDGDQWYQWSPDGKWFLANFLSADRWSSEVGLIAADGKGELVNLTRSGYEDNGPVWAMNGQMMMWSTDKNGLRDHGGWRTTDDIYGMFFTQEAWDKYHLTEAELALANALKDDDKKKGGKKGDKDKENGEDDEKDKEEGRKYPDGFKPKELPEPLTIDLEGIEDRVDRMTIHSSSIGDAVLTEDGEQLFYLTRFEKGMDLWSYKHRENEVKLLAKLGSRRVGGLVLDGDEKNLFVLADGGLKKIEIAKGSAKPVSFSATMELDAVRERDYLFEHVWRQTLKKFYKVDMHGVDWEFYKKSYARFLPWINNNEDFADLLSEMLGELNASHTGSGHRPRREDGDATGALGAFFDPEHDGDGLKIAEVIHKGPLVQAKAGITAGMIIDKIDGQPIKKGANWYPLLNHKVNQPVLLSITDPEGKSGKNGDAKHLEVIVKPVSLGAQGNLLYDRWIELRRQDTERLSKGRLGYVHVRGMNSRAFRDAFADILGRYSDKEGLVVDTRFNSGGNLTEFLADFLSGTKYARNVPRGQIVGREPSMSWSRPSIVVQNEGNYSDAHYFPWVYRELGIGKLVGTQVPGTATAVWWETLQDPSLYFGIPQVGVMDNRGELLENLNLEPDVYQDNEPGVAPSGRDQQLEKAIEVLLQDIDRR